MKYVAPKLNANSFTCPHCGVLSKQDWSSDDWYFSGGRNLEKVVHSSHCNHCNQHTLWINDKICYPEFSNCPYPNPEMPESVKKIYLEAAFISSKSPRGAAALLRLAIQILCIELGENGKNINNDIKELVKKGLPLIVQQSLDIVRVTGNDAVHPGQIDTDNSQIVNQLFELVNVIIEYMIALPKKVSGIYSALPKEKLDGISERDNIN